MEFLFPPNGDNETVILLLITSYKLKPRLVVFQWDYTQPLERMQPQGLVQRISLEDQIPLLLIPLRMSSSFMIVRESGIRVYKDLLTGNVTPYDHMLEHPEPSRNPGSSKAAPVFTQWARPMRTARQFRDSGIENIYLCREDGIVRYLVIKDTARNLVNSSCRAGTLLVNVNTAFAVLNLGPATDDVLVAGGDMGPGGIWKFAPREECEQISTTNDWTPINDLASNLSTLIYPEEAAQTPEDDTEISQSNATSRNYVHERDERIFACTGRGVHATISEFHYGPQLAKISDSLEVSDLIGTGIQQIWPMSSDSSRLFVLISQPTDTSLICVSSSSPNGAESIEDLALDFDSRTTAAGITEDGTIVQVTEHSVRAASTVMEQKTLRLDFEELIEAADVCNGESGFHIVLALKEYDKSSLRLITMISDGPRILVDDGFRKPLTAPSDKHGISCIRILDVQGQIYLFMASLEGVLKVFPLADGIEYTRSLECAFADNMICESMTINLLPCPSEWTGDAIIHCGLRNGTVQVITLEKNRLEGKIPKGSTSRRG